MLPKADFCSLTMSSKQQLTENISYLGSLGCSECQTQNTDDVTNHGGIISPQLLKFKLQTLWRRVMPLVDVQSFTEVKASGPFNLGPGCSKQPIESILVAPLSKNSNS
jgi:hypothetical protein